MAENISLHVSKPALVFAKPDNAVDTTDTSNSVNTEQNNTNHGVSLPNYFSEDIFNQGIKNYKEMNPNLLFMPDEIVASIMNLSNLNAFSSPVSFLRDDLGNIINYTEYNNGKSKEIVKDGKILFIEDLHKTLNSKPKKLFGIINLESTEKKQQKLADFKNYISAVGITDFLTQYEVQTGSDFIDDIITYFDGNEDAILSEMTYIASQLAGTKREKPLQKDYCDIKQYENEEKIYNNLKNKYDIGLDYIIDNLKDSVETNDLNKTSYFSVLLVTDINEILKRYPQLINDINNTTFSDEDKKSILKIICTKLSDTERDDEVIKTFLASDLKYIATTSLNRLSKSVKTDEQKEKAYINILKSIKAQSLTEESNSTIDNILSKIIDFNKPNGKIDEDFLQGNIGDCWLLAGLMAIKDKPDGEKYLNSLINIDDKNENVIVNLKGAGKTYSISKSLIKDSKYLSYGDGDIRAIELAIDKYIAENALMDKAERIDIDGNEIDTVFKILIGNSTIDIASPSEEKPKPQILIKPNIKTYDECIADFNNPKKAYAFGFSDDDYLRGGKTQADFYCTEKDDNDEVELFTQHAYSVVKTDGEYIYFRNPHRSSKVYKFKKDFLEKYNAHISSTELNF